MPRVLNFALDTNRGGVFVMKVDDVTSLYFKRFDKAVRVDSFQYLLHEAPHCLAAFTAEVHDMPEVHTRITVWFFKLC